MNKHHDDAIGEFDLQVRTWHVGHQSVDVCLVPDVVGGGRIHVDPTHKGPHR